MPHIPLRQLPTNDRPRQRLQHLGPTAIATAELLAIILQSGSRTQNALHLAESLLAQFDDLPGLSRAHIAEITAINGIGQTKATQIKAALELGRRLYTASPLDRPRISSPADAANLLMSEMMYLEQEQLRLILLDTRNHVIATPTLYIGSLNTSMVRIGELFRDAIRRNAAALIAAHNHPSGDPAPSPEDVNVTRQMVQAGKLLDIDLLDHIIIGRQRFVFLKERGLGFD